MGNNMNDTLVGAMIGGLLSKAATGAGTAGMVGDNPMAQGGISALGSLAPLLGAAIGSKSGKQESSGPGGQSALEQMILYSMEHPGAKIPVPQSVLQGGPLINFPKQQQNIPQMMMLAKMAQQGRGMNPMQALQAAGGAAGALGNAGQAMQGTQGLPDWTADYGTPIVDPIQVEPNYGPSLQDMLSTVQPNEDPYGIFDNSGSF